MKMGEVMAVLAATASISSVLGNSRPVPGTLHVFTLSTLQFALSRLLSHFTYEETGRSAPVGPLCACLYSELGDACWGHDIIAWVRLNTWKLVNVMNPGLFEILCFYGRPGHWTFPSTPRRTACPARVTSKQEEVTTSRVGSS